MENKLTFDIETDEIDIFLQDVNEHLQAMEAGILRLERGADPGILDSVFRDAHTLKAVAATVGHQQMAELTHTLETLFGAMREDDLSPTQTVTDDLLATVDGLKALRDEVVSRRPSGVNVDAILARLRALMDNGVGKANEKIARTAHTPPARHRLTPEQAAQAQGYRKDGHTILEIRITASDTFAPAARLLQAGMALEKVGQVIVQYPSQSELLDGQHDDHNYSWLILATQAGGEVVEKLLGNISELSEFRVQPYRVTVDVGKQERNKTVRISVERLDTMMNLVGELVTDRTRLVQIEETLRVQFGRNGPVGTLSEMATHFGRVVDQLQKEVMQARMLPIAHLFEKFPRLVRDLARAAGKQVDLVIEGKATELDRSVIEAIGDPLIHLLRNAVDHGIESPEERTAAGKPKTGTVWLAAGHEEGHVVITVRDDGRGIDPARIRRAAVERDLLSEEEAAQLDGDAITSLIFQPNLSTVEQVTDVSGRGVGLDVVRTNVKRLSGSVVVESEAGKGTSFRLTLPLTLAIVQTMLVGLGEDVYAIPLTSIVETLYLSDVTVSGVKGKPVIYWRDSVLPLVYLRQFFAHSGERNPVSKQAVVTVASVWWRGVVGRPTPPHGGPPRRGVGPYGTMPHDTGGKQQVGLVVDELIGKREIVIKSLSPILGNVPGLSGCTILGDGHIALIVDIPGLVSTCSQTQGQGRMT